MAEIRHRMREITGRQPTEAAMGIVEQIESVPSSTFYFGLLGSILLSLWLFLSGRKWESLFVGLWAPTLMSFGLFSKLVHPLGRETR